VAAVLKPSEAAIICLLNRSAYAGLSQPWREKCLFYSSSPSSSLRYFAIKRDMNVTMAGNTDMQVIISSVFSGIGGVALSIIASLVMSKRKSSGIQNELKTVKAENIRLNKLLNEFTKNPLVLKHGIYYDTDGNAYCPACYGSPYDRIPLSPLNQQGSWTLYRCPKCKEPYEEGKAPQNTPKRYSALDDWDKSDK
jgi:hypothetical protein